MSSQLENEFSTDSLVRKLTHFSHWLCVTPTHGLFSFHWFWKCLCFCRQISNNIYLILQMEWSRHLAGDLWFQTPSKTSRQSSRPQIVIKIQQIFPAKLKSVPLIIQFARHSIKNFKKMIPLWFFINWVILRTLGSPWLRGHKHMTENQDLRLWVQSMPHIAKKSNRHSQSG